MSSVNKAIILGRLGKDPESRYMPDGTAVTTLSVATSNYYRDQSGNRQENTEWHRIVLFGRQAEIATEYLKKGNSAYFEGRNRTRKWKDKNGVDRYTPEIVADKLTLLGRDINKSDDAEPEGNTDKKEAPNDSLNDLDSELPF